MPIKWSENLAVGVGQIDDQHKELFERMNELLESCNQGKGKDAVRPMIGFLEDYVVAHFTAEEKLQKSSGYPQFAAHKAMHTEYLRNVADLKTKLEEHGPTLPFVITVNKTVVEWLSNHIAKVDKELGQYLQSKNK